MTLLALPDDPALWRVLETNAASAVVCVHGHVRLIVERTADGIEVSVLTEAFHLSEKGLEHHFESLTLYDGPVPDDAPVDLLSAGVWIAARAAGAPARQIVEAIQAVAVAWSAHLKRPTRIAFAEEGPQQIRIRVFPLGLETGRSDRLNTLAAPRLAQALRLLALLDPPDGSPIQDDLLFQPVTAYVPRTAHAHLSARDTADRLLAKTGLPWPPGILPPPARRSSDRRCSRTALLPDDRR